MRDGHGPIAASKIASKMHQMGSEEPPTGGGFNPTDDPDFDVGDDTPSHEDVEPFPKMMAKGGVMGKYPHGHSKHMCSGGCMATGGRMAEGGEVDTSGPQFGAENDAPALNQSMPTANTVKAQMIAKKVIPQGNPGMARGGMTHPAKKGGMVPFGFGLHQKMGRLAEGGMTGMPWHPGSEENQGLHQEGGDYDDENEDEEENEYAARGGMSHARRSLSRVVKGRK